MSSPFSIRRSIAEERTPAAINCLRVTTPCWRDAIRAATSSAVLDFPRIAGKSQDSVWIRPLDVDVDDHRREQQRQVGERRQVEAQRRPALARAEELHGEG